MKDRYEAIRAGAFWLMNNGTRLVWDEERGVQCFVKVQVRRHFRVEAHAVSARYGLCKLGRCLIEECGEVTGVGLLMAVDRALA